MNYNSGSIQSIERIPKEIRELYKTVWEISVKTLIKMAADRGAFIDQSQSFNIHVAEPNYGKLTAIHFYGWKSGLKTGMYYLRTKPACNAIQFTVDKQQLARTLKAETDGHNGHTSPATSTPNTPSKLNGSLNGGNDNQNIENELRERRVADMVCSLENKDDCMSCGS